MKTTMGSIKKIGPKRFLPALLCLLLLTLCASCAKAEEKATMANGQVPSEKQLESGFIAASAPGVPYYDENGSSAGLVPRGTEVKFEKCTDGRIRILFGDTEGFLDKEATVVSHVSECIPAHTLYVRSTVNLRDEKGKLLEPLAEKGAALQVIGCDYVLEDGNAHAYRVSLDGKEGYVMPHYLAETEEDALKIYDDGKYAAHEGRTDRYGGGGAADLDYFPREKGPIDGNPMPEECRTLYLNSESLTHLDEYVRIADDSNINAFVVDITDGGAIGYAAEVMRQYSPTAAAAAKHSVEDYRDAIQKLKDAGYYVIGRITTFNDSYFIQDHPECAITDENGAPLTLSGAHWPSAYNRTAWQYKVDLAVEAVELMGFHEIQFDYVRFPDRTSSYEKKGTIDFHNTYGETKAQAIQRFLMYAADLLRDSGAYVSADVYGESAYTYVTAYGQYWPAISNVVDAISGMPYPDHFGATDTWLPWEHPYETLLEWGRNVANRQSETATPAAVRTWIQAYNAIRPPYNTYGPDQISAQIRGLRDAGCSGGYLTWNAASSLEKYRSIASAF